MDWGPSAPQPKTMGAYLNAPVKPDMAPFSRGFTYPGSDNRYGEDCLFINVWTPGINDAKKRPVLVWLHGGGFLGGSAGALDAYIGENLSKSGDVVVCSINHRLNAFGFINLAQQRSIERVRPFCCGGEILPRIGGGNDHNMDVDLEAVGRFQRRELMAFVSKDNGKTWSNGLMLDDRNGISYPDGQQTADGSIHLIWAFYHSKEQEIVMPTFREEDVLSASDEPACVKANRKLVSKGGVK